MCEIKPDYIENSFSNYFYVGKKTLEIKMKFLDEEITYIIPQKSFLDFVKELDNQKVEMKNFTLAR